MNTATATKVYKDIVRSDQQVYFQHTSSTILGALRNATMSCVRNALGCITLYIHRCIYCYGKSIRQGASCLIKTIKQENVAEDIFPIGHVET